MRSKQKRLLPKEQRALEMLGENIKLARLRRKLTTAQVAERANISRKTLWHIEKGSAHISIGMVLQVLSVLGFRDEVSDIAKDDLLGRKLQDMKLLSKQQRTK